MQLATPFLIPSATDFSQRLNKKSTKAKVAESINVIALNQTIDQGVEKSAEEANSEAPSELAQQNLAQLLASCCDCV